MSVSTAEAFRTLEHRARRDPNLAETIRLLAGGQEGPDDPFADPPASAKAAASGVNARRTRQRSDERRARTLDTTEVIEIIASIRDRKGVDRRRQRGQLLGWREGRRTLHPVWQFDPRLRDTLPGLGEIVQALAEVASDAQVADGLMTGSREDLQGGTLAELFARGRIKTAVSLILAAGDQS